MVLTLDLPAFRAACRRVAPALGSRLPIFLGIKIAVSAGNVTIEAQDGEMHFGASVPGSAEKDIAIIVPGRMLLRFLDVVQGNLIDIEVDNASDPIRFVSENVELSTMQFDVADWPTPEATTGVPIELNGPDLASIRRVLFAVSNDPDRGVLTGVHMAGRTVTATDNARLAQAPLSSDYPECIIPGAFLSFPLKLLGEGAKVKFELDTRGVCIRDSDGFWNSQLILGGYPDVSRVLGVAATSEIRFDQVALRNAIDRVSVLEGAHAVRVALMSVTEAEISTQNEEGGRIRETLGCEASTTGELCFVLAHLRDAVRGVGDEVVVMRPSEPLKPLLISSSKMDQALIPRRC